MKSVNIAFSVANCLDKCQAPPGRLNLVINLVVIKKEGQKDPGEFCIGDSLDSGFISTVRELEN